MLCVCDCLYVFACVCAHVCVRVGVRACMSVCVHVHEMLCLAYTYISISFSSGPFYSWRGIFPTPHALKPITIPYSKYIHICVNMSIYESCDSRWSSCYMLDLVTYYRQCV